MAVDGKMGFIVQKNISKGLFSEVEYSLIMFILSVSSLS
jgi:hypothetical protein